MKAHLLTLSLLAVFIETFAQSAFVNWLDQNHARFIENIGQFAGKNQYKNEQILYAIDEGRLQVHFTKDGFTYCLDKIEKTHEHERRPNETGPEYEMRLRMQKIKLKVTTETVAIKWQGINSGTQIIPLDLAQDYFNYTINVNGEPKSINYIKGYKKLLYKNIYPNIDLEYTIHPRKGFKYSFILHPGANPGLIQMRVESSNAISMDEQGNLHYSTMFGDIIDHAPHTYYYYNPTITINSSFKKIGTNLFTFDLEPYNLAETVIIDPWTIAPSFSNSNRVWEIETDDLGNVYAYGGDTPARLRKYNSAGTLLWTYNTTWDTANYWMGTLRTNPVTGTSYITSGSNGEIRCINTTGGSVWFNNPNGILGPLYEYWKLDFNCDRTQLICGGMRAPNPFSLSNYRGVMINLNMSSGAVLGFLPVGWTALPKIKEVRSICTTPGNNIAFMTLDSIGEIYAPSMTLNYRDQNVYNFSYYTPSYSIDGNMGSSAMCADEYFLYTRSGSTLHKRNFSGGVIATVSIPGGSNTVSIDGISPDSNGLDVDASGNVYVGSSTGVYKFNSSLTLIASATTPNVVYDVAINPTSNEVVACGNGFIASVGITTGARVNLPCVVLPVQLVHFDAQCLPNDYIAIQWTTESEKDNEKFILERGFVPKGSIEVSWEVIATIKGAGNSHGIRQYEFIDKTARKGVDYYYRLKNVNKNGQQQYFKPIQVQCFDVNQNNFVYPTVSEATFTVQYNVAYSAQSIIEVLDMQGRKVYTKVPQNIIQDNVVETLNLGHLAKGMYLIVARTPEKTYSQKVTLK
ncbi:MAG: T9SS type A sorting domain-containing protein [Bacteroidia bacterium]|nr:T9SS type A sorting domain-containing protein [Bacteroidia bacterium]MDW8347856.1 T9SS type A sorting domain-containing protein [Bacteroidia bacterium]